MSRFAVEYFSPLHTALAKTQKRAPRDALHKSNASYSTRRMEYPPENTEVLVTCVPKPGDNAFMTRPLPI
jgi:hypothetical protein